MLRNHSGRTAAFSGDAALRTRRNMKQKNTRKNKVDKNIGNIKWNPLGRQPFRKATPTPKAMAHRPGQFLGACPPKLEERRREPRSRGLKKIYNWMGKKTYSRYADQWLAALFFIEAVFFIPVDPLLMLFCIENRKKSLYYASIATVSSVMGGIFGYFIGAFLWGSVGVKLVSWFISEAAFGRAVQTYKFYQNWAVLIAGFTPLPYKAITLSAGFCQLPIIPFIVCSLISRGARFFLVAGLLRIWGGQVKYFIDRYFNQLVVLFVALVIIGFFFLR